MKHTDTYERVEETTFNELLEKLDIITDYGVKFDIINFQETEGRFIVFIRWRE